MKVRKAIRIDDAIGSEISFVDHPCNQASTIVRVAIAKRDNAPKADMTKEEIGVVRKFFRTLFSGEPEIIAQINKVAERKDVSDADKARAKKEYGDVNFADEKNKRYPIDSEAHVRAAWSYINMPKNAAKYSAADLKTIKGKIMAAGKKYKIDFNADSKAALPDDLMKAFEAEPWLMLADTAEDIQKDLYTVGMAAQMLEGLHCMYQMLVDERAREGDDSQVPEMIQGICNQLADALIAMTQEETNELKDKMGKVMGAAEDLLKQFNERGGIFAGIAKADAPASPAAKTATAEDLVKALNESGNEKFCIVKGMNQAELEALAQGAHDAMAAAGAPPHAETEGGDDVGDAKADTCIDLIKHASGISEEDRGAMLTLMKAGAKFSKKTAMQLNKAHDLITKLGAKCENNKAASNADIQKAMKDAVSEAVAPLLKALEAKDGQIKELSDKVEKIASQPQPVPAGLMFRDVVVANKDGSSSAYVAPGATAPAVTKAVENIVAPNGQRVSKVASTVDEILPGLAAIQKNEGVGSIDGLLK